MLRSISTVGATNRCALTTEAPRSAPRSGFQAVAYGAETLRARPVNDQLSGRPALKAGISARAHVKGLSFKASSPIDNRAENSQSRHKNASGACGLSQVGAYAGLLIELEPDPSGLRARASPTTCIALSRTARAQFVVWRRSHREQPPSVRPLSKPDALSAIVSRATQGDNARAAASIHKSLMVSALAFRYCCQHASILIAPGNVQF